MLQLQFLGGVRIRGEDGEPAALASRRHPVALLALLASAPAMSLSRGKLVGLLWPESAEHTARNRLNTCVHQVRSALGEAILQSAGDELRLDPAVDCDVRQFESALAEGDHAGAVRHYGGAFLDGFHLSGSTEFEDRVSSERERLARSCRASLELLAEKAMLAGLPADAVEWLRRRADEDRCDARVARQLMEALDASGNRAEALRVAQAHAQAMQQEFGSGPDPQLHAFASQLQAATVPAEAPAPGTPAGGGERGSRRSTDDAAPHGVTIAVLPFANLSRVAEADPFAAGLHDDLLTDLSRIDELTVIARTSVLGYRDSRRPVQDIARELGVGTLVEGAVQSSGGRLRVNVQLIDAHSGGHLWAERYDRLLSTDSLFDIQSDLVTRIVRSLRATLAPAGRPAGAATAAAASRPTADLEAYRLHAQGHQQLVQLTDASLRQALAHFRAAIDRDPGYAQARVGLADALTALLDYGYDDSGSAMAEAEAALRHALELQPHLAEARAGLGKLYVIQRKGPAAIRELTRAIDLMPTYGQAYDWLSWTWQCLGRRGQALDCARRAVELEPLLREAVSNLSATLMASGRLEEALAEARRTRELGPDWSSGAFYEGVALYRLGRFAEAQSVLQGLVVEWTGSGPQAALALACTGAGDTARARRLLSELEAAGEWFSSGLVHAALGDPGAAFAAFEQVVEWGAYWPTLALHQYFPDVTTSLADDARFKGMLANVHRAWGLESDGSFPA
jgi:TolB-like protein/DNA-binding SARP family transcriptional activator/tetratricopeptide (TPR) repeat protein